MMNRGKLNNEEIAEGLHGDYGAGTGIVFRDRILEKNLQGFPCATAEIGKKLPIVKKVKTVSYSHAPGAGMTHTR